MNDTLKAIGFPVAVVTAIISWHNIATSNVDVSLDTFAFLISVSLMLFMYNYNLPKTKN